MTKSTRMGIVVMAVVVALAGTACRQDPKVSVQKAMDQARLLLDKGNVDGAVAALQKAYDGRGCASFRPQLLGAMIQINLMSNRVEAAQAVFKKAVSRNPEEAGAVVGMIEEAMFSTGRFEDLVAWSTGLRTLGLKEGALVTVAEYHCRALEKSGKTAALKTELSYYVGHMSESAGLGLIERRFGAALGAKDLAGAEAMIVMASSGRVSPERTGVVARLRVDLLLAQGKWAAAAALFKSEAGQLPENVASVMLNRLVQAAAEAKAVQDADALCRFVLDGAKDRPALRSTAAGLWIGTAMGDKAVAVLVERLGVVWKAGFTPAFVLKQIDRHYSTIMAQGSKTEFVALLVMCQAMAPELPEEDRARMVEIRLDLCFYLDKFADALAIVEQGVPGRDPKWSSSLISKIKAHLCLQQGKPREAVTHFREFMDMIAQDQADQIDPLSGNRITKEMILGLNAKRIGDILAADGDKDGAAKAYQEAREDYAKALTKFTEGAPEYTKIKADVAAIPGNGR